MHSQLPSLIQYQRTSASHGVHKASGPFLSGAGLSISPALLLRINFQIQSSDNKDGRRMRMKALGAWRELEYTVDNDEQEEEASRR